MLHFAPTVKVIACKCGDKISNKLQKFLHTEIMRLGKLDVKLAHICIQNALEVHEIKALIAQCVQVDEKTI